MGDEYFTAAIPEPTIIFGVKLLPLSLGRYRLLHRFGCEFVSDKSETCDAESLITGIFICGMTCAEFLRIMDYSEAFKVQTAILRDRILQEVESDEYFSLYEKFGLFRAYIADGSKAPPHFVEMENENHGTSHWSQSLELTLRHELHYTEAEIDEGPMAKALADYFSWAESQGAVRLIHDGDLSGGEQNAEAFARAMKEAVCPA